MVSGKMGVLHDPYKKVMASIWGARGLYTNNVQAAQRSTA